jgi:hypothetical protein
MISGGLADPLSRRMKWGKNDHAITSSRESLVFAAGMAKNPCKRGQVRGEGLNRDTARTSRDANSQDNSLKGLCHQILYLFWRSNNLNKYFL